ncbi:MAG: sensor histidine kinase, partial [Acidimicrobiia bacterium]
APAAISIDGDPHRLGQVVANLVENARKFARTTVWVSARIEDGSAVVCIDDDGPGIAPADLPHVFERLYVSKHQPVRGESSSGLGLAIVAELVEAHGGTVVAQVAPTGGARMMVRLPLPS